MTGRRSEALAALLAGLMLVTAVPARAAAPTKDARGTRLSPREGFEASAPSALSGVAPASLDARRVVQKAADPQTLPDGSVAGVPVTGDAPVVESVYEIAERQGRGGDDSDGRTIPGVEAQVRADRTKLGQNPDSPEVASWPVEGDRAERPESVQLPQTVSTNWTAATLSGTNPSGSFPPDSMGAIGPTQYLVAVNNRIVSFDKTTGAADGMLNVTTNTFFASVRNGANTKDPKLRYDRLSGRWFVMIVTDAIGNRILLAVSNSGTITTSTTFSFFFIDVVSTAPAISATCSAGDPSLGVDANALYIGANNYCGSPNQFFDTTDAYVVRKSSVLGAGPIVVTAFRNLLSTGAGPYTPQGVDNFDATATEGYFVGVDQASFGKLMMRRVTNPGGTPVISANLAITVPVTAYPSTVQHLGNTGGLNGQLDALDDRLYSACVRNGKLWTAHTILVDRTGSATGARSRNGCRWYQLQNLTSTPSLAQSGTVFEATASNDIDQRNYWMPTVMVSGQGHVAMGFSTAGTNVRADAATCGRLSGDALGTMRAPTLYTSSSTAYNPAGDPGNTTGMRRWGNYSYTSLDPSDDMTMWTIQEFCDSTDSYGVRVAKLLAPPPATPASASPASVTTGASSVNITVTGTASNGSGFFDPGSGFANRITASVSGGVVVNSVTYVSPTSVIVNVNATAASAGAKNVTVTNPDGQSLTGTGLFSVNIVSAVGLVSFTSAPSPSGDGSSVIAWKTGFEVDNLGFNVVRVQDGRRTLLTPALVAGSAMSTASASRANVAHEYAIVDRPPAGGTPEYWLEDVDVDGVSRWHGPAVAGAASRGGAGDVASAPLLRDLGAAEARTLGFTSRPSARVAPAFDLAASAELAGRPALKLSVREEGWYRVSASDLPDAIRKVDPRTLQLWADGKPVPALVAGEQDGRFDASDSVEFYGQPLDLQSTGSRTYWLVAGSAAGVRIKQTPADPTAGVGESFVRTVERKDRLVYFPTVLNGDRENFYGQIVNSTPLAQTLTAPNVDTAAARDASLEVSLQAVTLGEHVVEVSINGTPLGSMTFHDRTSARQTFRVPAAALREGDNVLGLTSRGAGYDLSLVDTLRLSYTHSSRADDNVARVETNATQTSAVRIVDGFTSPGARVVDVTDPSAVTELGATAATRTGGYAVAVRAPLGRRTLFAFTPDRVKRPAAISVNTPSTWRSYAGADFVIVANRSMLGALAPLVSLRTSEGLTVAVVDLEDVYDEFSFGEATPYALRAFLAYASAKWTRRPQYVLFAGACSYDPRDYFGRGGSDFVPTKLVDMETMESASDDWLVDFDGDGAPDLSAGRIPARSVDQLRVAVAKTVAYASSPASSSALLVSDLDDSYGFTGLSAQLGASLGASCAVSEVRRSDLDDASAHDAVLAGIARGPKLVSWMGHGSIDFWRGNLLTAADAGRLQNGAHPALFTLSTCLNGYLVGPQLQSLAEDLLAAPSGGAVAVWASSSTTYPTDQAPMLQALVGRLASNPSERIGDSARAAKAAADGVVARRSWILFGDPTARIH